ncbi:JAB domain-containing protein [Planktotalea sp.]
MTKLIKQAADSLSITLHDHLIVGATGETSFVSEGLL